MLDHHAIGPYVDFLAAGGVDGIFVLGTTGEGILLSVEERMRAAELFREAAGDRLAIAVHCGAQSTVDTKQLTVHSSQLGVDAIAVVAPPYYALDDAALLAHFAAAARACAPTPFFVYEFAARSGYAVPPSVIERLREEAPNLAGLKVSDTPWERFERYLLEGLDIFVGPEALIVPGLERGAVGTVSGLAAGFPELVSALVRAPEAEAGARAAALRAMLQRFPFNAALKFVLGRRGLPVREDVRAPLRTLTDEERVEVERLL